MNIGKKNLEMRVKKERVRDTAHESVIDFAMFCEGRTPGMMNRRRCLPH